MKSEATEPETNVMSPAEGAIAELATDGTSEPAEDTVPEDVFSSPGKNGEDTVTDPRLFEQKRGSIQ